MKEEEVVGVVADSLHIVTFEQLRLPGRGSGEEEGN